jgi:hypothetical protein
LSGPWICCHCDCPLSCAACGVEQPNDSVYYSQLEAENERLRAQVERLTEALEDAREYISGDVENGFRPAVRLTEKITAALTSTERP